LASCFEPWGRSGSSKSRNKRTPIIRWTSPSTGGWWSTSGRTSSSAACRPWWNASSARAPVARLAEVFRSIVLQSGGKFKLSAVGSASAGHALKDALQLLVQAGLAYRVVHTPARGIPLGAEVEEPRYKTILFDIGMHQRILGLDIPSYLTASDVDLVNKGSTAEVVAGLELVGNHPPHTRPS
jgi:hypothetical protein